jgi:hypothetical protein
MKIEIDGTLYLLMPTQIPLTEARAALYRLLYAIAAAHPEGIATVRSEVLMELLQLKRLEAYESRLNNLLRDGYLLRKNSVKDHLEHLISI